MKLTPLLMVVLAVAGSVWAQNAPILNPPQGQGYTYTNPYTSGSAGYNNPYGQSSMTFSNRSGAMFSIDQLAAQMKAVQAAVDQALPTLAAFNEDFVAGNPGANSSLGGTLSNLLSGVLRQNNNNNSPGASTPVINLMTALRQNSKGVIPSSANVPRDLQSLQTELTSVQQIFQNLGVVGGIYSSPGSQVISSPGYPAYGNAPATNNYNYTPTGR